MAPNEGEMVSGPNDDDGAALDRPVEGPAGTAMDGPPSEADAGLSDTSNPSRKDAILRIGIVVGVLVVRAAHHLPPLGAAFAAARPEMVRGRAARDPARVGG